MEDTLREIKNTTVEPLLNNQADVLSLSSDETTLGDIKKDSIVYSENTPCGSYAHGTSSASSSGGIGSRTTTHSGSKSPILSQNARMENSSSDTDATDPGSVVKGSNDIKGINGVNKLNGINGNRTEPTGPEKVVTVLGSGDYGRALAGRLVRSGYTVYIGSRDPNKQRVKTLVQKTGAILTGQDTALAQDFCAVVVAVGRDHYDNLPLQNFHGRVLIDVSNNTETRKGPHYRSNAEYLQGLVPEAHVVKGFNVLSAYALENGSLQRSIEVYIASDDDQAKRVAMNLVRGIGCTPVDWGSLKAARDIEDVPLKLMPSWKRPVAVVFGLFSFHWILALIKFQICHNLARGGWDSGWKHLGMQNFNRVIAVNALWTLSFCYLPGLLAAYLQLWRGTKYSQFPNWLDQWLKMRKQLGLLMLGMAAVHACISVAKLNPQTTKRVYEQPTQIQAVVQVDANTTETKVIKLYNAEFNWSGELFLTTGAVALCLTVVLGISSLPSVTATLSWREFTFIQSKLGWVTMITAALHDILYGWEFMFTYYGCFNTVPVGPQYALYPTFICLVLKLPLLLPPVDKYLQQIRKGYERPTALKKADIA